MHLHHAFEGSGPHCEARMSPVSKGDPRTTGVVTTWVGCGYPRSSHPDPERREDLGDLELPGMWQASDFTGGDES